MGDNGKPKDNMLMHRLSPYPAHCNALSDCEKLWRLPVWWPPRILISGYDYPQWPMRPAIDAFEVLARRRVKLDAAVPVSVEGQVHPVHQRGCVYAWQVSGLPQPQDDVRIDTRFDGSRVAP